MQLFIQGIDSVGLINEVTKILSTNLNVNIQSMNISSSDGVFDGIITVLYWIKIIEKSNENIRLVNGVNSISRKFKTT